ncbi:MAG: mechanosensitive ion channel family protein [Bacteroidota bacterium]|nr:mechanosensitive ion channel family protein [Bacteroidota bacterium]
MDIKTLKNNPEVKSAGAESTVKKTLKIGTYVFLAAAFITLYFLLKLHVFAVFGKWLAIANKFSLGAFFAMLILLAAKIVEGVIRKKGKSRAYRYNLIRLINLVSIILVVVVIISFLFVNWYTAAVSLGLISLILGFALQTPITSFIGWINILIRAPYHVGDRIQIDTFKGDVVEINYFDTTLWEFGGDYLTNDVPSGRLIRFPNSLVLQAAVFNYSWRKFPYIWNEIPFHVAYESDLDYVSATIKSVAKKELGPEMELRIEEFKSLVKQTPVDELDIKEYPFVSYRISTNTWVEVMLTYLVEPKKASHVRTALIGKIIAELLKSPDKVMFPKSNAR